MKVGFNSKELAAIEEALRSAFGSTARAVGMAAVEMKALIAVVEVAAEQAKAEEIEEHLNDFNYVGSKWHY